MLGENSSIDAVAAYVHSFGVRSRPLREIIAMLAAGDHPIEDLVRHGATPRRMVEEILRKAGDDVVDGPGGYRLRGALVDAYRSRFELDTFLADYSAENVARAAPPEAKELDRLVRAAPPPSQDLDHVAATADTLARRARWINATYDLAGRRVLCVGDHDLTSIALARTSPETDITVVDVDERVLDYIDAVAREQRLRIRTLFADLRLGLPPGAREWADLVFTDPPYTPEGAALFVGRGLAGLRDRVHGVVLMAFGHSRLHPMLGFQAQQALARLGVVFEGIIPAFNRYHGAQAVGSASDLYICVPTSRTWKVLDRVVEGVEPRIYTHGTQSLESGGGGADESRGDLLRAAAEAAGNPVGTFVGEDWAGMPGDVRHLRPHTLFSGSAYLRQVGSGRAGGGRRSTVLVDLAADSGPLLARALLAVTADSAAFLVTRDHPDVARRPARDALAEEFGAKYDLTFRTGAPDARHTLVLARPTAADRLDRSAFAARWLLERAHGRIGNVLREGLIRAAARDGETVAKNAARATVRAILHAADLGEDTLELTAMELPRARLRRLLAAVATERHAVAAGDGQW